MAHTDTQPALDPQLVVRYGTNPPSGTYHHLTGLRDARSRALAMCGQTVRAVASDLNYGRTECARCRKARGL